MQEFTELSVDDSASGCTQYTTSAGNQFWNTVFIYLTLLN